jgi:hypothetical protein
LRRRIIPSMFRGGLCALFLLCYALSAHAQRTVGVSSVHTSPTSHSSSDSHPAANTFRALHGGGRGHTHRHHNSSPLGSFPFLLDLFGDYGIGYPENVNTNEESPEPLVRVHDETAYRGPVQPSPAQVIEIPNASKTAKRQSLPATIFVLTSGEKLETQGYLLTASSLYATVQHRQRTIALEMLDMEATLSVNRERGLDLRIPENRNEVSVRF